MRSRADGRIIRIARDRIALADCRKLLVDLDHLRDLGRPVPEIIEQGKGLAADRRIVERRAKLRQGRLRILHRLEAAIARLKAPPGRIKAEIDHACPLLATAPPMAMPPSTPMGVAVPPARCE
ncbi:MAG: hypothetical protein EPO38_01305 [Rhizorhabdus sp.]|nr:MAG: hypothetical protein EPO38_01305 [Rhizorhabdus sp.]